jgi:hypothetical protein
LWFVFSPQVREGKKSGCLILAAGKKIAMPIKNSGKYYQEKSTGNHHPENIARKNTGGNIRDGKGQETECPTGNTSPGKSVPIQSPLNG